MFVSLRRRPARGWIVRAAIVLAAGGLAIAAGASEVSADRLRAEVESLRARAAEQAKSNPAWADMGGSGVDDSVFRAATALAAGRTLSTLDLILRAEDQLGGIEASKGKSQQGGEGLAELESAWKKERAARDRRRANPTSAATGASAMPAAVRALAETARGKAGPLFDASRAYGEVTSAAAGFYYLGESRGVEAFADFAEKLGAVAEGSALTIRSPRPELDALQAQVLAAFQPPRSIDRHPDFIRLNSTLKLAGELANAGLSTGALYQVLNSLAIFAAIDAPEPDAGRQAAIRAALDTWKSRFAASGRDDSIARLFLERAETALSPGPDGKAPGGDLWKSVAALVEHVLPAYLAFLEKAPADQPKVAESLSVTLVRWPYT
ncbi:MAG: hypothetical protein U0X73_10660 [Thermoanaerobaculia bacterium]